MISIMFIDSNNKSRELEPMGNRSQKKSPTAFKAEK